MEKHLFTYDELWETLKFLAQKENITPENFVAGILSQIKQQKIDNLAQQFMNLDSAERQELLTKLGLPVLAHSSEQEKNINCPTLSPNPIFQLQQLKDMEVGILVKSKPGRFWLNGNVFDVQSWKDVTICFVRALINGDLLRREMLPFYPSPKSRKAYVNFFPGQPNGSSAGLFVKINDNFYVDIKHNAKYHVLNIWWTLCALKLQDNWKLALELKNMNLDALS